MAERRPRPAQAGAGRDLEYQAGEEEPQSRDQPRQAAPEPGKERAQPAPGAEGGEEDGEEEGGEEGAGDARVNEADEQQYEDRTFAAPQARPPAGAPQRPSAASRQQCACGKRC